MDAGGAVTAWHIVGASVRGSSHERGGSPCQDAHAYRIIDDRWVVIAVADGAGSAALADVGARLAADHAVETLSQRVRAHITAEKPVRTEADWRDALNEVLRSTRAAVEQESAKRNQPVKELSSTLLILLLGPSRTIAVQIGDGAVVALTESGTCDALTLPRADPEGLINETIFLTSAGGVETAQFALRDASMKAAAVLTDGLQLLALAYPDWQPFTPFFQGVFEFFAAQSDGEAARLALERLLISPDVRSRTDDDVTLLVATRGNHHETAPRIH